MIVLRQKAAPPKEANSALGFLSGLSGLPAQIGQIQAYQQQQRQNEALNQAKIAESAANTNKINIQSSGLQSQQDALTALPGAFDTLHRQQNGLPATGPAGNLVAHQSVQPAQIGEALSALTQGTGSNLSQVGDFQLDQDNLQGRNQARDSVLSGDFGQASALNAISQGQAIPEQFGQSGGIVSNLFDGGVTPETLGVVESLIAENQGGANQSNAHAGLYNAQALVQPSEIALNEAQAAKALRQDGGTSPQDLLASAKLQQMLLDQQNAATAQQNKVTTQVSGINQLLEEVDLAIGETEGFGATGIGNALTGGIPTTPAFNLNKRLDTIKGNLGFDKLQAMRDASPTGGALGQVSERELTLLTSTLTSLDGQLDDDRLRAGLEKVRRHYENWKLTVQGINPDEGGSALQQPSAIPDGGGIFPSAIASEIGNPSLTRRSQPETEAQTATNPTTGEKIISYDGGVTWQGAQ